MYRLCQSPRRVPQSLVLKPPHYNSRQSWVLTNMLDFQTRSTAQYDENKQSANARTRFHGEITERAENSDPDLLMSRRNLRRITEGQIVTGLEMWAPDWCVFWKMNTCRPWPYIPPSTVSQKPQREGGGGEGGRAAWWTSGTGEHPRQWYLIRLPHPSTGRRTMRGKKKTKNKICHIPALQTGTECKRWELRFLLPPLLLLLLLLLLFWFKSWATLVEIWGGAERK